MKKLLTTFALISLIFGSVPLQTGCTTEPSGRVTQVQTLKIVGTSAKASIDAAAQLLKNGQITVPQWQSISAAYDTQFQPAYNLAVVAAQSNLSSVASPDIVGLAAQLAQLVAQLTAK